MDPRPMQILTVSQLTLLIRSKLESEFPDVWIEGEVSNFKAPQSGHLYFTLKDAAAQIRAVFFRSAIRSLKFLPKDGIHVVGRGRITVYEPRGEYQVILDYLEPKGVGALQLAFEQLKEKLWKEGLFDEGRKRPLPLLPRKIGIVTSPTGAALRDILKVCRKRFANIDILIAPAAVQGERSAGEIVEAIADLNRRNDLDAIILARGGGGIEDLWSFNEEAVARAICASRIPVISAVGHETDYTIADFAADYRAPTPSAAAEKVVQNKVDLQRHLDHLNRGLAQRVSSQLDLQKSRTESLRRLLVHPRVELQRRSQRLDDYSVRLGRCAARALNDGRGRWKGALKHLTLCNPLSLVDVQNRRLASDRRALRGALGHAFKLRQAQLEGVLSNLRALNPLAILARGYSIAFKLPSLNILRKEGEVKPGDRIRIRLQEGTLVCLVEKDG
jgi:exodeoxyribonuclease VII large subunit